MMFLLQSPSTTTAERNALFLILSFVLLRVYGRLSGTAAGAIITVTGVVVAAFHAVGADGIGVATGTSGGVTRKSA